MMPPGAAAAGRPQRVRLFGISLCLKPGTTCIIIHLRKEIPMHRKSRRCVRAKIAHLKGVGITGGVLMNVSRGLASSFLLLLAIAPTANSQSVTGQISEPLPIRPEP